MRPSSFPAERKRRPRARGGHADGSLLVIEHAFVDAIGVHRVTAGPFTLVMPSNGRATLFESDGSGVDHECPWGVGHFEALTHFAGEVIRLNAMIESMRESRSPIPTSPHNPKLLVGLRSYATDWRDRAASKDIVEEAIGEIERLHLWMEFIQHNSTSPEAREYAGEALNGAHVPDGYDWDERSGRNDFLP